MLIIASVLFPFSDVRAAQSTDTTMIERLSAISSYLSRTYGERKDLAPSELIASIRAGIGWLKNAQEESGRFKYEYLPFEGTYRADDNIVRQAGALYALGEVARRIDNDELGVRKTMERSIHYFESLARQSDGGGSCIAPTKKSVRCQLGATALALIGTISFVESFPDSNDEYQPLIESFVAHLLASQKANGGFRNLYMGGNTKISDEESAFSNGEALLALVRYYRHENDDAVRVAIDRAFAHLSAEPLDSNLYLWMMASLKDMHALWPKSAYTDYASSFTSWRMQKAKNLTDRTRNYCAYAEGLASATSVVRKENDTYAPLIAELNLRNARNYSLQITEKDRYRILTEGGLPKLKTLADAKRALGGFLTGDGEPSQRIDFTQHCIGAYVQTLVDILGEKL